MLAFYRKRAGLEPKAQPYGGWDGDGRNLTGHIAGHYLSAVSLMWAATGDARFKERADYIVSELKDVQDKHGDGYLGALAARAARRSARCRRATSGRPLSISTVSGRRGTRCTRRTRGLRDAYRYAGNRTALDVEIKFAAWAEGMLWPAQRRADPADAQHRVRRHERGAGRSLRRHRRPPLARAVAQVRAPRGPRSAGARRGSAGRHARQHAGAEAPRVGGPLRVHRRSRRRRRPRRSSGIASCGHHTFATGGHGKDEYFGEPDKLGDIVDGRTAETCNVYNMLKLTRRLFALQPDVELRRLPRARALQSHPRLDRSGRRRDVLHGAGRPRRAARVPGHVAELHLLRRLRHGEPCPARGRHLLRIGRPALGQPVRAVDGGWEAAGVAARHGDDVSRRESRRR